MRSVAPEPALKAERSGDARGRGGRAPPRAAGRMLSPRVGRARRGKRACPGAPRRGEGAACRHRDASRRRRRRASSAPAEPPGCRGRRRRAAGGSGACEGSEGMKRRGRGPVLVFANVVCNVKSEQQGRFRNCTLSGGSTEPLHSRGVAKAEIHCNSWTHL